MKERVRGYTKKKSPLKSSYRHYRTQETMSNEIVDLTGIVERMKDKLSKPQEVIDLTKDDELDLLTQPTEIDEDSKSQVSELSEEGQMVTKVLSFHVRMPDKDWKKYDVLEDVTDEIQNYLEFSQRAEIVEYTSTDRYDAKVHPIDLSNQYWERRLCEGKEKDWQTEFLKNNLPGECFKY